MGGENMLKLTKKRCIPCNGEISSLTVEQTNAMLREIPI